MSYYQKIFNRLRQQGLSEAGAIGMLGNWQCESNCEPNRVQGDFSPYRTASKQYVADVTSGRISRDQFGHDGKGFGDIPHVGCAAAFAHAIAVAGIGILQAEGQVTFTQCQITLEVDRQEIQTGQFHCTVAGIIQGVVQFIGVVKIERLD